MLSYFSTLERFSTIQSFDGVSHFKAEIKK